MFLKDHLSVNWRLQRDCDKECDNVLGFINSRSTYGVPITLPITVSNGFEIQDQSYSLGFCLLVCTPSGDIIHQEILLCSLDWFHALFSKQEEYGYFHQWLGIKDSVAALALVFFPNGLLMKTQCKDIVPTPSTLWSASCRPTAFTLASVRGLRTQIYSNVWKLCRQWWPVWWSPFS